MRRALPLLAAAVALLLVHLPLFSQASQSAIQGAVYDQTHAVIAGATVTVIDVARGNQRALTTDSAGEYGAANLIPGMYTIRAEAKGFETVQQSNVVLEVGQTVRVDLTLMPGEQTQTVTVTSEAPAVDTSDAQFGGTVSNDLVNSLPLNGRNFQRLVELRPGLVTTAPGAGTGTNQYTDGRKNGDDLYRIEGMASICNTGTPVSCINSSYRGGDSSSILPIDAIQEFDTEQNPKAQDGWKEGSFISVGLKGGTNSIHGTAYAFGRDTLATDAANAFTGTITPATLEQFGATAGGRVIKDKIFWFAGYEGLRDTLGDTAVVTIPSDVSGGGVAASMIDACNNLASSHAGALTGPYNPIGTKGPNGVVNALSAQLSGITINPSTGCTVSPASSTVENVFPYNPNVSTSYNPPLHPSGPLDNGLIKADYIPGPHHHIGFTFFDAEGQQVINNATAQLAPQWMLSVHDNSKMYVGSWTWAPNSAWVNDVRFGVNYILNNTFAGDVNMLPSNPWPTGYGMPTGVTNPIYGGFPNTTFSSFTGSLGAGTRGGSTVRGPEGNEDLVDNVSYLRGKHAFKFGFEYIDIIDDQGLQGNSSVLEQGSIKFTTLQNFLQGTTNGGSILVGDNTSQFRSHWYAGFAQDDWRIEPRVTLNLGIRYELEGPMTERNNYLGNFNPNVNPATTPAIQRVGPGQPLTSLFHEGKKNFSPRVGVAWDVNGSGKNVVRASFGLLTDYTGLQQLGNGQAVPFGANFPCLVVAASCTSSANSVNTSGTALNAHTPASLTLSAAQLNAGWNLAGPIFPVANSQVINGVTYAGSTCDVPGITITNPPGTPAGTPVASAVQCTTFAVNPNYHQPHAAEWSLDIERAITNNLTVDIAYVGNYGYGEQYTTDLNQPQLGVGWFGQTSPSALSAAATCVNSATDATPYDKCTANAALEVGQYSTQFPYLKYINQSTNGVTSNYNGLQVILTQRVSHGLSFLAGYSFAHALGTAPTPDPANLRDNYGPSVADIRHRFTISPSYLIPGMKSPGQMLEGWSVSALITAQSALPWYPSDATTNDLTGTGEYQNTANQTWNYVGPRSAFVSGPNPIPCYGPLSGCTIINFSNPSAATAAIAAECTSAAIAPYAPGSTQGGVSLQALALASLNKFGCYLANGGTLAPGGGILTPPAYGTLGNAGVNIFRGPNYFNVDMSLAKIWKFRERYSAQFRAEFFNLFNKANYAPTPTSTNPAAGAGGQFGCSCSTPDTNSQNPNPVLGSGGPRHIQFALKLIF